MQKPRNPGKERSRPNEGEIEVLNFLDRFVHGETTAGEQ